MIDKINTNCLVQVNFLHFTYESLTNHKISLPMNWGLHDKYMYYNVILIQEISMDPYRFNVQWVLNHTNSYI